MGLTQRALSQLFDLLQDLSESNNLAEAEVHRVQVARFRRLVESERVKLHDGNTPYAFSNALWQSFWSTYEAH